MNATGNGLASRKVAHGWLMAVLKQRLTLDEAMRQTPAELLKQDAAFAYHLAKTTLRYARAFDKMLAVYIQKPLKPAQFNIQCCLYLGAAQLCLLDTPAHAAVDTTVELAKSFHPKMAGLVNAVCKAIARDKDKIQLKSEDCLPEWMWQSWVETYGQEHATSIATGQLQEPALDVNWSASLAVGEEFDHGITRLPKGTAFDALEGAGWAQDFAAALPISLLGDVSGLNVLDACAAPGGKTMQLARAGAKVTAIDISKNRLKRLEENLERNQLEAEIICADLRKWQPEKPFDLIVLDAPCSATGTIRRHPEIMHHRTYEDVSRLVKIQQSLIDIALKWLTAEGRLLYISCSLQPEEGEGHLQRYRDRLLSFASDEAWITPEGCLRTTPAMLADKGGMDGFFAMLLSAK